MRQLNPSLRLTRKIFKGSYEALKACSSILGGLLALFILQSYLFPRVIWQPLQAWVAKRNGLVGYVYYEVGESRGLTTSHSQLFLLTDSQEALYEEIKTGDRLIVKDALYFHLNPSRESPVMYTLGKGQCVIVIDAPKNKVKVKQALSGGYLHVATTSCGIF